MEDLETLLKRAKLSLAKDDYEKLELLHDAYLTLTGLIEDDRMTIRSSERRVREFSLACGDANGNHRLEPGAFPGPE